MLDCFFVFCPLFVCLLCFSGGGVAAHTPKACLAHTAGFAQPLWHIARASSSPMLPNIILTRSQLGMADPGFEATTLWLDIWSGLELLFWPHKSAQFWRDPTDPLLLSVRLVRTLQSSARAHKSLNSLSLPQI